MSHELIQKVILVKKMLYIKKVWPFAYWIILHAFPSSDFFFSKFKLSKNSFTNTIRMANSLDPDQAQHIVGPDLGPTCFQSSSAEDTELFLFVCLI